MALPGTGFESDITSNCGLLSDPPSPLCLALSSGYAQRRGQLGQLGQVLPMHVLIIGADLAQHPQRH